mgnify:CR=1 FL=1
MIGFNAHNLDVNKFLERTHHQVRLNGIFVILQNKSKETILILECVSNVINYIIQNLQIARII